MNPKKGAEKFNSPVNQSNETNGGKSPKLIPSLSVEPQAPLKLNLDLSGIQLSEIKPVPQTAERRLEIAGGEDQPQLRPATPDTFSEVGNDIFFSDDDFDDEEEKEEKNTEHCFSSSKEMMALKLMAERRLYQSYQEELMRDNQKLRSDLQEKEDDRMEIIEELRNMVESSSDGKESKGR